MILRFLGLPDSDVGTVAWGLHLSGECFKGAVMTPATKHGHRRWLESGLGVSRLLASYSNGIQDDTDYKTSRKLPSKQNDNAGQKEMRWQDY